MCACAFCALGPAFVNAHYKQILLSAAVFDAKKQNTEFGSDNNYKYYKLTSKQADVMG